MRTRTMTLALLIGLSSSIVSARAGENSGNQAKPVLRPGASLPPEGGARPGPGPVPEPGRRDGPAGQPVLRRAACPRGAPGRPGAGRDHRPAALGATEEGATRGGRRPGGPVDHASV